jgi:hypothetical protein
VSESTARAFEAGIQSGVGKEELQKLARVLDSIAWNFYSASGALEAFTSGRRSEEATEEQEDDVVDPEILGRLWQESAPNIRELSDVGLPSIAHHLLETLETFIPHDPAGVFLLIHRLIRGGEKSGYQYDSMAETVLVRVVARYLAEYRSIFQRNEETREALVEILDTFVRAGSLGARRLSYGLDGIFR